MHDDERHGHNRQNSDQEPGGSFAQAARAHERPVQAVGCKGQEAGGGEVANDQRHALQAFTGCYS
ncbi:MAG TPA: hypothetical protein VJ843_03560 [Candidatus Saccharimonadales bacterium]|nr:hypothetical protein [Candidatus Saccharimonadales bacterium]